MKLTEVIWHQISRLASMQFLPGLGVNPDSGCRKTIAAICHGVRSYGKVITRTGIQSVAWGVLFPCLGNTVCCLFDVWVGILRSESPSGFQKQSTQKRSLIYASDMFAIWGNAHQSIFSKERWSKKFCIIPLTLPFSLHVNERGGFSNGSVPSIQTALHRWSRVTYMESIPFCCEVVDQACLIFKKSKDCLISRVIVYTDCLRE